MTRKYETLALESDNIITWDGLKNPITKEFVNDATVVATLYTAANSAVTGATGISLAYVSGSNGRYQGVIEDDVELTDGAEYYIKYTATASGDLVGRRKVKYLAQYQDAS